MTEQTTTLDNLPEVYRAMGITNEFNPASLPNSRIFLLGEPWSGKTVLMSSMPGNLIIDHEKGASNVPGALAHHLHVPDYAALEGLLGVLEKDKRADRFFRHVTFDPFEVTRKIVQEQLTAELWEKFPRAKASKTDVVEFYQKGGGHYRINERCLAILCRLYNAGYGYTVVTHMNCDRSEASGLLVPTATTALSAKLEAAITATSDLMIGVERRDETVSAPVEITLPDGRKITKPGSDTVEKYVVSVQSRTAKGYDIGRGARIEIDADIELPNVRDEPLGRLWETLEEKYDAAVERMRRRDSEQRTAAEEASKEQIHQM